MTELLKVGVVGTGYWGKNHVRVLSELDRLGGVYDLNEASMSAVLKDLSPQLAFPSFDALLASPHIQAVVIATSAESHHALALQAMAAGKHVLVEKPLAINRAQAAEMIEVAQTNGVKLMVGHLLRYHPALIRLKALIEAGELGNLEYMYSNRLNMGKIRSEENILWSFAPHDISLMLWLLGRKPIQSNVVGGSYLQPNIADTTISSFLFGGGIRAHIYVSWLHPFKEQRLVILGSKKMAVFDEQWGKHKLLLFDKRVSIKDGQYQVEKPEGIAVDYDREKEPLKEEALHFISCIENNQPIATDGQEGLEVLSVLEACQKSLEMNGQAVQVN